MVTPSRKHSRRAIFTQINRGGVKIADGLLLRR